MTSGYNITDLVQEARIRWLKPEEVLFILQNYEEKQLTNEPPQKPPSGSLFLFNKSVLRFFRTDGHNWRRKKDGRTVGEAHERLMVGNVEALNCYYAHGELNPNFQRRCYWMLDRGMDHIVLVHYRDITMQQGGHGKQLERTYGGMQDDSINFPPSIEDVRLFEHSQHSSSGSYASGQPPSMGSVRPLQHSQLSGDTDDVYDSGQSPSTGYKMT